MGLVLVPLAHPVVAAFRGAGDGKRAVVIDGLLHVMSEQAPLPAIAAAFDDNASMIGFSVTECRNKFVLSSRKVGLQTFPEHSAKYREHPA